MNMKCKRCNQDIEADAPIGVVTCGSCADYLRQEEDAQEMAAEFEEIEYAMNKEAYEESQREGESVYRFM